MFTNFKKIAKSFSDALKGLKYIIRKERNFKIEVFVSLVVLILMIFFSVAKWEAVILILLISLVLILETLNTTLERLVNLLKPRVHPQARILKDLMAGAVFLAALASVITGIIIFWPYIFE